MSAVSKASNTALNAVRLNSAVLDFYGHPKLDPMTETYFNQAPLRFGDYIAKLRVRPLGVGDDREIEIEDRLRDTVTAELRQRAAEFAVEVQLCTDLERMPVENAHARWPEDDSPYREVARLVLRTQDAASMGARNAEKEQLSFSPAHSLEAHRPLGSIVRARMRVYQVMAARRREANGLPTSEPVGSHLATA